ncbi:hypothetical protein HQ325_13340 [Rhodococcus sp. BP-349]|uniref:Yip1 family protein n=1 Tax=unclassified Rhodococcus (in: high G+C Gram-positive bacteria) TaxID=192944 RepID=UPI001C9AE2FD|nr:MULTISPECIES: Yip1 family protein [unclassified Rhodococcus (in: high G+C Gram-positive bacteria)]MBY6539659.1 hypothetical protein [Rhodococcus sp. BP-363]MBY6544013.1 hypothetical protein [Rhodococcus sp. BP-369]MBY6563243.1 hypothetical protein [Rhodococcus sp. BP-370]MBY6577535.1 hypothetical protein [Rhodococcus sp. BP-364]MBY6586836.1 hypothetical protein [Rhodococcus sp. BP-358]
MSDDNNGSGAADTGQVSVAELLARNGAKVDTQSGGGRRRRGMAGGISVAELTGEIPIVRDETPAEAPDDDTDASPETESPQDQPQQAEAEESTRDAEPERPAPAPEPTRTTPRIDDRRGDTSARPTPAFGAARSARPEPALFSGAPSVAVDRLRASTEERALAPERSAQERPASDRLGPPEQQRSMPAEPEVDADEVTAETDAVTTIVPAVTDDPETPDTSTATDDSTADDTDLDTPTDAEPVARDAPVATSKSRSPVKQWLSLIGQGIVAIVLGALLFKGFERLWEMLPWVALVLAFFVIVGLVAVVRVLRRTDDIVSILLAVVVGGFVTLGPLAFMLSTT